MSPPTPLAYQAFGSGQPLVLLHGLLVDGTLFAPLLPLLTAHYRLIVPDLRGHGASRAWPPPYTAAQHAADIAHLLDTLAIEQTHLLGYSQGGTVAQQIARDYPQRVQALFLVCTFAYNRLTWREQLEARLTPWLIRLLGLPRVAAAMTAQTPELSAEQAEHLRAMITGSALVPALAALHALNRFDSRPWLPTLTCPTHLIAGARDTAVPLHHAHQLQALLPHATLEVIADATHTLIWTHPDRLAQLISAYTEPPPAL